MPSHAELGLGSAGGDGAGVGVVVALVLVGVGFGELGDGVEAALALSTVRVFRLVTFWLPIPAAWLAVRHLRTTDAV